MDIEKITLCSVYDNDSFIQELKKNVKMDIVIPLTNCEWVLKWVANNFAPDQVYSWYELKDWAENEGFILPSKEETQSGQQT